MTGPPEPVGPAEPLWVPARHLAERLLREQGWALLEEIHHPGAFGSWYAVFGRGPRQLRLVWDGKEQLLGLQSLGQGGGEWDDLAEEPLKTPGDLKGALASLQRLLGPATGAAR